MLLFSKECVKLVTTVFNFKVG